MSFSPGNNSANFNSCAIWNGQNGNVTTVGSNGGPSYYGTFDQSGNVYEWNDLNGTNNSFPGIRGGGWHSFAFYVSSDYGGTNAPSFEVVNIGFRLASSLNPLNLSYFVGVGDPNNSNDTTGYGRVDYLYQISQYLVTNCEYVEFLNSVAKTDTYNLYSSAMGSDPRGGITRTGTSGNFVYNVKTNMANKPVNYLSWFDAARYCNWLHNGKPTGSQNNSTTEDGAYTLNGAVSGNAVAKNSGAAYWIPTENEWYKAAYYKGGGTNAGYWTYATQSDATPTCVTANSFGDGPVASNYCCGTIADTWAARETARSWYSVASNSDGSKLVAVVYNGQIYTSSDSGASWTARETARNWRSVASNSDGSKLVAVVYTGQIYTSTDSGVSWTARESTRNWISVASNSDGSKLVAVVYNGQIYTSTDSGVSWTARETARSWISVASNSDGSKLVAVEYGGQIYTSTNSGASWTPRETARSWYSVASNSDGSKLVAVVYGGQIYTSSDSGASWTARETARNWRSVASNSDGSKLVAVVYNGQIYTSTNSGASWTPRETARYWYSVASNSDGSKLVAVNYTGQIYTSTCGDNTLNPTTPTPTNTNTPTNSVTPTVTPTVTKTPTRTPEPTSLPVACRDSCCYYVCVENYDENNNCITNTIIINFNGDIIQNFNNDEYQLLIEGNCVDPFSNTLDIKNSKDDCYGCSIVSPISNNSCENDNNLFKIVAKDNEYQFPTIVNNVINLGNNNCSNSSNLFKIVSKDDDYQLPIIVNNVQNSNNNISYNIHSINASIPDTNPRCCAIPSRTPTVTPTNSVTPTLTATPTVTPTNSVTPTETPTPPVTPDSAPSDPYFSSVSLLLHFDGSFADSSANAVALTVSGDADTSDAVKKFGSHSGYFDGDSDYIYLTAETSPLFGFGTGDFTLECWVYPLDTEANDVIIDTRPGDVGQPLVLGRSSAGALRWYDGATVFTAGFIPQDEWSHIAWSRSGGTSRLFVNGQEVDSFADSADCGSSRGLTVGANADPQYENFYGYIDDLRITKGTARYTANFTPPTAAFPNSGWSIYSSNTHP